MPPRKRPGDISGPVYRYKQRIYAHNHKKRKIETELQDGIEKTKEPGELNKLREEALKGYRSLTSSFYNDLESAYTMLCTLSKMDPEVMTNKNATAALKKIEAEDVDKEVKRLELEHKLELATVKEEMREVKRRLEASQNALKVAEGKSASHGGSAELAGDGTEGDKDGELKIQWERLRAKLYESEKARKAAENERDKLGAEKETAEFTWEARVKAYYEADTEELRKRVQKYEAEEAAWKAEKESMAAHIESTGANFKTAEALWNKETEELKASFTTAESMWNTEVEALKAKLEQAEKSEAGLGESVRFFARKISAPLDTGGNIKQEPGVSEPIDVDIEMTNAPSTSEATSLSTKPVGPDIQRRSNLLGHHSKLQRRKNKTMAFFKNGPQFKKLKADHAKAIASHEQAAEEERAAHAKAMEDARIEHAKAIASIQQAAEENLKKKVMDGFKAMFGTEGKGGTANFEA